MSTRIFSPEEKEEMRIRPVGSKDMTGMDFKARLSSAQAIEDFANAEDPTLTQHLKEIYKQYPRWGFYTDKETKTAVYRVYGVIIMKDKSTRLHVASCKVGWTNDIVGGIPSDHIVRIDQWSKVHRLKIRMSNCPYVFLDPYGWTLLI